MRVRVTGGVGKRRQYVSELIGDGFYHWKRKKVFIAAPMGMGKSTFIVKVLLPYHHSRGEKLLILCNRKLLRMQYWYELIRNCDSYQDLMESVEIETYQSMSARIRNGTRIEQLFWRFEVIVCDEAHYFYADSDFNGFGTFALLQAIIYAGDGKEMIFMSATMEEVKPLIYKALENNADRIMRRSNWVNSGKLYDFIINLDYSCYANFERFRCVYVSNEKNLCEILAESDKKTIFFIDNKKWGTEIKEKILQTGLIESREIIILNADNLEDECNSEVVKKLAIANLLVPKILITTAVLDNGVSIKDPDVGNVVIITESKISFLQMLGRVRIEAVETCNLYFLGRKDENFRRRKDRYEKECECYEMLEGDKLLYDPGQYITSVWDKSEEADFYLRALVWMPHEINLFRRTESRVRAGYGKAGFYVNQFAKIKAGDMYMAESLFYSSAVQDPKCVVYEQMRWIGKEPEELEEQESEYRKTREQEFVKRLLSVQKFTSEDVKEFKVQLVKDFKKEFFDDTLSKNGTISNEKLKVICARFGLELLENETENRKKIYTIKEKKEDELC